MRRTEEVGGIEAAVAVTADARSARARSVWPLLIKTALVLTGVGVLTASAWISVPFYPVPMTLQTLAVLLVGGLLGPRLGVAAVTGYLALGIVGAPVFHNGLGGAVVLAGPTGGYLMGFVPAAYLMGVAAQWGRTKFTNRAGMVRKWALVAAGAILAEAAIYTLGLPWLALYTTNVETAVAVGFVPFLLGDLVKTSIAVIVVCGGRKALDRWGSLPF